MIEFSNFDIAMSDLRSYCYLLLVTEDGEDEAGEEAEAAAEAPPVLEAANQRSLLRSVGQSEVINIEISWPTRGQY